MRFIVCGGRTYFDKQRVYAALDALHRKVVVTEIIEGGAPGADDLAGQWAEERGITHTQVPAQWHVYGKAAGPKRNAAMLAMKPDGVVAFPGGTGTADMVRQAEGAGVKVWRP